MDKLTLITLAAQQPRRAVVLSVTTRIVECAHCCLRVNESLENGNSYALLNLYKDVQLAHFKRVRERACTTCRGPLEFE
jgi:hypothetical protein